MKIGIDARFYGITGKGLGRYTEKLIASLEELDLDNEYVVFLRRENFDEYQPKSPNFRKKLADYRWYSFSEQVGFLALLYRGRFDVVHFPHFNVPVLYRRPFVVTVHDLILLHYPTPRASTRGRFWYWMKFIVYRRVIWSALRRARTVLTVSEFTKGDLLENYRFLRPEKIRVTYQSADDFCRWRAPEDTKKTLGFLGLTEKAGQKDKNTDIHGIIRPYALYVGNAYPHKNLEALVDVIYSLSGEGVRAVFVGKDDYFYTRLKDYATRKARRSGDSRMPVPPAVIFAGGVDDATLAILYRYARIYVFPSLYEGFGLPPLEAMAVGTPVVASDRTSIPEIVGDAGLYFNPEDEKSMREVIRRAWTDKDVRVRLRDAGHARIRQFSWNQLARETLATYTEK